MPIVAAFARARSLTSEGSNAVEIINPKVDGVPKPNGSPSKSGNNSPTTIDCDSAKVGYPILLGVIMTEFPQTCVINLSILR